MSRRLKITLPDSACDMLAKLATDTGESLAGVTARLVLGQIEVTARAQDNIPVSILLSSSRSDSLGRGSLRKSRRGVWDSVRRLYARYPQVLSDLPERWWENDFQAETLCALADWRSAMDAEGCDPREELAFHTSLHDCGELFAADVKLGSCRPWRPPRSSDLLASGSSGGRRVSATT
jgi:hypothetical protein